jgi:23S rRNA pseudouridine1911/1915/1917 synthase
MTPGFQILFEEGPCLVVCKPPGLPTQAPPGIDSLEVRIKAFLDERAREKGDSPHLPERPEGCFAQMGTVPFFPCYLGVPHRLDRPASGAMVFGTRRRATQKLAKQFEHREIKKLYWALVEKQPEPATGTWQDHLRKVYGKPQAEVVPADHPEARLAVLHYRTLASTRWGVWLEIELETGRTHQIRIQAASRGHPVLGDSQYGSTVPFGPQHADERLRAIALHARMIEFRHPTSKELVSVTAPAPEFWENLS